MCGIVGVYSVNENVRKYEHFIKWSLSTMKRRGPNSSEIYYNGKNYINGFNRLSIRDLSDSANQPMISDCKNFVLSFNGEIYNTDHIKNNLRKFNIQFKTKSDTEVLLYALKYLDIEYLLNELDGIFAFSFYSKKENSVILARDRAGIKPL
jgi:asparagine synthase (glutamine-hydrolysing)